MQELQPWLCPQHPLAPPRLLLGSGMETCSGKSLLCLCPSGRSRRRGLLGMVWSCSCCQLWVCHCLCLLSKLLPLRVCLCSRASKGHKWWKVGWCTHLCVFLCTKRYKCFKCFCPGPFSPKHTQGLYLAELLGMMQHQRCRWVLNDSSKNELVLQLGTVKWELRQYHINDVFYSEENYLQKKQSIVFTKNMPL